MTAEILERGRALANDAARLVEPWQADVAVRREELINGQPTYTNMGIPRRVYVNAMAGISATVVVTVVQGKVWMSISPPFTWEAIMEPGKVDELLHVLGVAREDAKKMPAARSERASHAGKAVIPAITSGGPAPGDPLADTLRRAEPQLPP